MKRAERRGNWIHAAECWGQRPGFDPSRPPVTLRGAFALSAPRFPRPSPWGGRGNGSNLPHGAGGGLKAWPSAGPQGRERLNSCGCCFLPLKGTRVLPEEKPRELNPGREGDRQPQAGCRAKPCREKSFPERSPAGHGPHKAPVITQQASVLAPLPAGGERDRPNPS